MCSFDDILIKSCVEESLVVITGTVEEIDIVAIGSASKALGANGHLILVLLKGSFYEAGAWD